MKKDIEFHIKNNDYFGTLATVLDLLRQTLPPFVQKKEKQILKDTVENLMHLQKYYRIVKKIKPN